MALRYRHQPMICSGLVLSIRCYKKKTLALFHFATLDSDDSSKRFLTRRVNKPFNLTTLKILQKFLLS